MTSRVNTFLAISTLLLLLYVLRTPAQVNECLKPIGCHGDECCFNIVPKTGEICAKKPDCFNAEFAPDCCRNSRVVVTTYGNMYGYAILLDDMYYYRDDGRRYLQIWLGIPYAKPPIRGQNRRFRPPELPPETVNKYDATHYRKACPQTVDGLTGLVNKQMDEDCLYLNIFVTNYTINQNSQRIKYPILVFLHGGEHSFGSPIYTPGHILAQTNIMVITVQYRLNVFGFLSLEDDQNGEAPGNYGLLDQVAAMKYIQLEIERFMGDPTRVTLSGHGSGASDAALHGMSTLIWNEETRKMNPKPYFHRALWMSGSDLTLGAFSEKKGMAKRYAYELGHQVGCTDANTLLSCLNKRNIYELAGAASKTRVHHRGGWIGRPWSPVPNENFVKAQPLELRIDGNFSNMRVIGGVCYDDGAKYTLNTTGVLNGTLKQSQFDMILKKLANDAFANDLETLTESLRFQYTWWPNPRNDSMRLQMYRDLYSDWYFGSGITDSLNFQADKKENGKYINMNKTQMYVLKYRSETDPKTKYMGAYHGTELQYLFGFPYLNNTNWGEMGLENPGFIYGDLDKNMSDYMMYMISNFVIFGNATPEIIRNLTWDTYRYNNRTYLLLDLEENFERDFDLKQNYRMEFYAFWKHFYPYLLQRLPRQTTPIPTAFYREQYRTSTLSLGGILLVLLVIILALVIIIVRRKHERLRDRM